MIKEVLERLSLGPLKFRRQFGDLAVLGRPLRANALRVKISIFFRRPRNS
jgi:hypothetical protein